jgi:hypothetical protein
MVLVFDYWRLFATLRRASSLFGHFCIINVLRKALLAQGIAPDFATILLLFVLFCCVWVFLMA